MGKPTPTRRDWQEYAQCNELSPKEADLLFFPGPGGKSKKAELYCSTCPVENFCLTEAIRFKAPGFLAGTTEDMRNQMVSMLRITQIDIEYLAPEPEPKRRPKQLKPNHNPLYDPLFGVDGPSDEEILRMETG